MCSTIGRVISSILEFRSAHFLSDTTPLIFTGGSSDISGKISYPFFSVKNTTVTAYLLESPLAQFKKFCLLFYNFCVFARVQIKNGNILLLLSSFFISSSVKESKKFIFSQNFPALVTCKTSKFVTKELHNYCCRLRGTYWNHQLISSVFEVIRSPM